MLYLASYVCLSLALHITLQNDRRIRLSRLVGLTSLLGHLISAQELCGAETGTELATWNVWGWELEQRGTSFALLF